jgi:hypothetical protein
MVIVDAVVFGGKFVPVSVTVLPVEADEGSTDTDPLGTDTLTVLVLLEVAVPPPIVSALSVTVT